MVEYFSISTPAFPDSSCRRQRPSQRFGLAKARPVGLEVNTVIVQLIADEGVVVNDFVMTLIAASLKSADRVTDVVPQGDVVGQDQYLPPMACVGINRALRGWWFCTLPRP